MRSVDVIGLRVASTGSVMGAFCGTVAPPCVSDVRLERNPERVLADGVVRQVRCLSFRVAPDAWGHGCNSQCADHWRTCPNDVGEGAGDRCDECWKALIGHPSPEVRSALLTEPEVPEWVMEVMSTDTIEDIAAAAAARLAGQTPDIFSPLSLRVSISTDASAGRAAARPSLRRWVWLMVLLPAAAVSLALRRGSDTPSAAPDTTEAHLAVSNVSVNMPDGCLTAKVPLSIDTAGDVTITFTASGRRVELGAGPHIFNVSLDDPARPAKLAVESTSAVNVTVGGAICG